MSNDKIRELSRKLGVDEQLLREAVREASEQAMEFESKPEPGTVVWWRPNYQHKWRIGFVIEDDLIFTHKCKKEFIEDIEYKPARVCALDEVPVKVPPVSEWPDGTQYIEAMYITTRGQVAVLPSETIWRLTREQAEHMDADQ